MPWSYRRGRARSGDGVEREPLDQLFARVAVVVASAPSRFRVHTAEGDARADLAEARARARSLYDLAGELMEAEPPEGWGNDAISAAEIVLAQLGDGWALTSVAWPEGLPERSLPDLAKLAWYIEESGLAAWCDSLGHRPSRPTSPGRWRLERRRSGSRRVPLGVDPLLDFQSDRDRERRDWPSFDEANRRVASVLDWWLDMYRLLVPYWEGDPGRPEDVGSDDEVIDVDLSWEKIASTLSWAREFAEVLRERGGQAEAIAGVAVVGAIARVIYFSSTASDPHDRLRLHLPPFGAIDQFVAEFGLEEWTAAGTPAPPN
jgi:hypothetical protein